MISSVRNANRCVAITQRVWKKRQAGEHLRGERLPLIGHRPAHGDAHTLYPRDRIPEYLENIHAPLQP